MEELAQAIGDVFCFNLTQSIKIINSKFCKLLEIIDIIFEITSGVLGRSLIYKTLTPLPPPQLSPQHSHIDPMNEQPCSVHFQHRNQILVFRKQPQVCCDVDLLNLDRGFPCNLFESRLGFVAEWAVRFGVELEFDGLH